MKKLLYCMIILILLLSSIAGAQEIMTAETYFQAVSENYGTVTDYEAQIVITHGEEVMKGELLFKTPNLMRINFVEPEDQVLVVDGVQLMLYLPIHHVLMRQEITRHSPTALATMTSEQGLKLLSQNYSVAFLERPEPLPLEEGSDEMVRKFKLAWRIPGQGFRQIEMSVDKNMMIRRMVGITESFDTFSFDFIDVRVNQDIPNARFRFEEPPSAYVIENFLFEPES